VFIWRKGIFCLEAEWFGLRSSVSVRPALEFLRASDFRVPFIHRDVATRAELEHYLRKWLQQAHSDFPVLWLSIHTRRGLLLPGDVRRRDEKMDFDDLEQRLAGQCSGRMIHFGGCRTIDLPRERIQRFLRTTRAVAVSGFLEEVDWSESTLFEMALLLELQRQPLKPAGLAAMQRRLARHHGAMAKRLGFRLHRRAR
jgi:hypothetical protein